MTDRFNTPEVTSAPADTAQAAVRKLDPAFKARWLEALRSGRYPQGRKSLKRDGCFCCLGVALDVIDSGQWRVDGWGERDGPGYFPKFGLDDTGRLSGELGISADACDRLAIYNDGVSPEEAEIGEEAPREGWTFLQIADWIEANL